MQETEKNSVEKDSKIGYEPRLVLKIYSLANNQLLTPTRYQGQGMCMCMSCGSFVYLGTLTNMDASATPEVRRRIGMALGAFGSLGKIWKSKAISRKTKSRLYTAIILSLMYNVEI